MRITSKLPVIIVALLWLLMFTRPASAYIYCPIVTYNIGAVDYSFAYYQDTHNHAGWVEYKGYSNCVVYRLHIWKPVVGMTDSVTLVLSSGWSFQPWITW